jgi:hypothetical protein
LAGVAQVLGHSDQFVDHLMRRDRPVGIRLQGLLE